MFRNIKDISIKIKEKIRRQAAILISSVSVLAIVGLASNEIGNGDLHTLTAFAETNAELVETAKESPAYTEEDMTDTMQNVQQKQFQTEDKKEGEGIRQTAELKRKDLPEEESPDEKAAAAVVPCSQEDYQVLLRIVEAEAGICDEKGKVLVANVILNRVRNQEFPDTIKGVVYQKSQFSPVANGSINTCKVTKETVDCVNRALQGEDFSQGALYFMNRGGARAGAANWFDGQLTFLFQHERHEFFK